VRRGVAKMLVPSAWRPGGDDIPPIRESAVLRPKSSEFPLPRRIPWEHIPSLPLWPKEIAAFLPASFCRLRLRVLVVLKVISKLDDLRHSQG